MSESVIVSIITVCYQADKTIARTMQSVLEQDFCDYEYIVKDGNSTDNTNFIVEQYKNTFVQKGITVKHIVSEDLGIYSAMNEALQYCEGEWIMFLNADDCLYSNNVLSDIFKNNRINVGTDIIYGDTDFEDENMHFLWKGNMDVVESKCPYCHQSSFVKKEWMKAHPFDETFKITADYDFILGSYKRKATFMYIPEIISTFKRGGASGKHLVKDRIEHRRVQLRYQDGRTRRSIKNMFKYIIIVCNAYIQELCFKILPKNVATKIRHYCKKKRMEIIGE